MAGHPNTIMLVVEWFVYILRCSDGSYYVGHTSDLAQRVYAHNAAEGATHTACRIPVTLVYSEPMATEAEAMIREAKLKRWSRAKKQALIAGDLESLHNFSRSRD